MRRVDINQASVEAVHVASEWLAEAMRVLVGIQCPVAGPERHLSPVLEHRHSRPGEPPFKETGHGQASIVMVPTAVGARIGPSDAGFGHKDGFNYMAGWDGNVSPSGISFEGGIRGQRRPWLSTWRRYLPEFRRIVLREMKMRLGAK